MHNAVSFKNLKFQIFSGCATNPLPPSANLAKIANRFKTIISNHVYLNKLLGCN